MREIKFRAYIHDIKKIYPVAMIDWQENGVYVRYLEDGNTRPLMRLSDIDLMQFTGLHDKNGKEIYEGDIVTIF